MSQTADPLKREDGGGTCAETIQEPAAESDERLLNSIWPRET